MSSRVTGSNLLVCTENISAIFVEFLKNGKTILDNGVAEFSRKDCLEDFLSSNMGKLFCLFLEYNTMFQSLGIENRKELDGHVGKHYRQSVIKDLADNLTEFEAEWDQFIDTIDAAVKCGLHEKLKLLEVGDYLPLQLTVIVVQHGNPVTLDKLLPAFTSPYLLLVFQRHFG